MAGATKQRSIKKREKIPFVSFLAESYEAWDVVIFNDNNEAEYAVSGFAVNTFLVNSNARKEFSYCKDKFSPTGALCLCFYDNVPTL